ncbi:MAG: alkaline phosphatase family protein [Deinococcales bacterium]
MAGTRALLAPTTFVSPAYDGGSLVNLPPTVGRALGVADGWAAVPLSADHGLEDVQTRRLLLLVIDGLGRAALQRSHGAGARLRELLTRCGARTTTLTSVAPATTTVATTALLGNGATPAETGLLGFSQRLPRLDLVANMLFWTVPGQPVALEARGVRPETFLATPSLFQVLEAGGVASASFLPAAIAGSPLSRLQFRGAAPRGFHALGEALRGAVSFVGSRRRAFAYVYLPDLDTVSHREGPGGPGWERVLDRIVAELGSWLETAEGAAGADTWVLLSADHGLVATPPDQRRLLSEVEGVQRLLDAPPAGEARHVYLYARAGAKGDLLELVSERLGDGFLVLDGHEALEAGLYGDPARRHPEAAARIGDVVVLARGGASLWLDDPATVLLGMHGSLEADEMQVPLFAFPLAAPALAG